MTAEPVDQEVLTAQQNREAWLTAAIPHLNQIIEEAISHLSQTIEEADLPEPSKDVRVSCGFPGGRSFQAVIGQCWNREASSGAHQIFVNPILDQPEIVLATLLHELIHAADDNEHGHKGVFVKVCRAVGLVGKPTATEAGPELNERLHAIAKSLGEYPHVAMRPGRKIKPQTTRMIKCACEVCGYTLRTTRVWLDVAIPVCPDPDCSNYQEEMEVESK